MSRNKDERMEAGDKDGIAFAVANSLDEIQGKVNEPVCRKRKIGIQYIKLNWLHITRTLLY